jgi:F420-dependent oxidoreductase-like protein
MQFGLAVIHGLYTSYERNLWDIVSRIGKAAEEAGFDSIWIYDHFMWGPSKGVNAPAPNLEAFVALSALAAQTTRLRLGQLVLGVPYRNPALVAKMQTSLDIISHGRTILGLGAAWMEREFAAYGWDFDPPPVRLKRLEEAIQVIKAMWTQRPASCQGQYYRIVDALNDPPPVQQPHPPIMIGGSGEKVTLRLVAQYADWANIGGDPERFGQRVQALREHCTRVGRSFSDLTISNYCWAMLGKDEAEVQRKLARLEPVKPSYAGLAGTRDQLIERFRAYAAAGSHYCTLEIQDDIDIDPIYQFAEEVIPALRDP